MTNNKELVRKFFLFGLVGLSGIVVDYSVTFSCKELLLFNKYVSNSLGFILAASSNYYLNRVWVFKSSETNLQSQYFTFIGIAAFGLIFNTLIIWLLTDKIFNLNFYLSKIIAIGIVFIWNFSLNHLITFRKTSQLGQ